MITMTFDFNRINKHFKGMNEQRNKLARDYDVLKRDKHKYAASYLQKQKQEIESNIKAMKAERIAAAKQELDAMYEELKKVDYISRPEKIGGRDITTTADETLYELKRMNDMSVWRDQLEDADSAEELKELHAKNYRDPDFERLFNRELKKRVNNSKADERYPYQELKVTLEQEPAEAQDYNRYQSLLTFIENNNMYPSGLETNGIEQHELNLENPIPNEHR